MLNNWRYRFVEFWINFWDLPEFFAAPRALPKNLVLVRHGESIGNVAVAMSKKGDHSLFEEWNRIHRHSKTWELTKKGREQAIMCGQWMSVNGLDKFDHYYVSKYDRAMETAGLAGLAGMPDATWHRPKVILRERDRGRADMTSIKSLEEEFEYIKIGQEQEAYLNRYPDGESLADVEERARLFNNTLEREAANEDAVVFCHGEFIEVQQVYYESIPLEEFAAKQQSKNPFDKIHNCQIVHYTREVAGSPGELTPFFNRVRSVCPWDESLSSNVWRPILSKRFTNQELLDSIPVRT